MVLEYLCVAIAYPNVTLFVLVGALYINLESKGTRKNVLWDLKRQIELLSASWFVKGFFELAPFI